MVFDGNKAENTGCAADKHDRKIVANAEVKETVVYMRPIGAKYLF